MTLALNKELAKRAVVLLRASSKQQTDREHDFDIPQQKSILLTLVESKGWDLVKVFTEGGVSGFKVSSNDQKEDLERQKKAISDYCYAKGYQFKLISDLGSGLNYTKKGSKTAYKLL